MTFIRYFLVWLAIFWCLDPGRGHAEMPGIFEKETQSLSSKFFYSGATHRVAVFTFEDPDSTGLGNDIARLLGQHILLNHHVSSIRVFTYVTSLKPQANSKLSYFDKIEKIALNQNITLAVWGKIYRTNKQIHIDTFVHVPKNALKEHFKLILRLPKGMKGGILQAHLKPNRVSVQNLQIPENGINHIKLAAESLLTLKERPNENSPDIVRLPIDKAFRIKSRAGDWAHFEIKDGPVGWIPIKGNCQNHCKKLLGVANFAMGLLRHMDRRGMEFETETLTEEAKAVIDQISAFNALISKDVRLIQDVSLKRADNWIKKGTPLVGAAFANIKSLAEIELGLSWSFLKESENKGYRGVDFEKIQMDKSKVREIAFELARASQDDPRNVDILHNLSVLFYYLDDYKRASLAESLVEKYTNPRRYTVEFAN